MTVMKGVRDPLAVLDCGDLRNILQVAEWEKVAEYCERKAMQYLNIAECIRDRYIGDERNTETEG